MRHNFIKAVACVKHPAGEPPPAGPGRVASDNGLLCEPCGLKSLDFFDTLQPPPKTPGNTPLQAGQLAVLEEGRCPLFLPLMTVSTPT